MRQLYPVSIIFFLVFCLPDHAFSQNVKIGNDATTPASSAALEIGGTDGGLLLPRMTKAQRLAIAAPANGLFVYQTNEAQGTYFYNGTTWNLLQQDNLHGIIDTLGFWNTTSFPHAISSLVGSGFTANRLGQGEYEVLFDTPFTNPPSAMVTAHNIDGDPPVPPPPTDNYCLPFMSISCQNVFNQDQIEAVYLESHIWQSTVPVTQTGYHGAGMLPPNPCVDWSLYTTPGSGPPGSIYGSCTWLGTSGCSTTGGTCALTAPGNYAYHDPSVGFCDGLNIYQNSGTPMQLSALPADSWEIWVESSRAWADAMGTWIDYNGDGDFNDPFDCLGYVTPPSGAECPTQNNANGNCGNATYLGSFNVPNGAGDAFDGFTVFRVMSSWTGGSGGGPLNCSHDCRVATWGETEDYLVEIINGTPSTPGTVPPKAAHCNAYGITTSGFKVNCTNLNGNLSDTKFHWESEQQ